MMAAERAQGWTCAGWVGGADGTSVAEHSPRELICECVPALNPLVLVLQAIKPVLQAFTLGIDAQNHSTCRRGQRDRGDSVTLLPSCVWTVPGFQHTLPT